MFKRIFLVMSSVSLVHCSTTQKFEQKITEKNCEEALESMPENQTGYQLVSKVQEASGTVLSYSATGAAYTVQVLWDVTATVGAAVVLCAPGIAVAYATQGHGTAVDPVTNLCLPADLKSIQAPYLGKDTYRRTENWNCPDVDGISRSIRKVAQCYAERGGSENQNKALTSLRSVEKSGSFYRCLSEKERSSFLKDLAALKSAS